MLEEKLKKVIPKELNQFPKINHVDSPYYFASWDIDNESNEPILRYWFWNKEKKRKNPKRIFLKEFEALIRNSLNSGHLMRSEYNRLCPKTYRDGTCGFAVIVAIMNHLKLIRKTKPGDYLMINVVKTRDLLN